MQLLTGGESIVLWSGESGGASFGVGGETTGPPAIKWVDSWRCKLSQPVMCLKFSSDGVMFASYGKVSSAGDITHGLVTSHLDW